MSAPPVDLSVATSLYGSAPHIVAFYERIRAALEAANITFELIFVDDGFPDAALDLAKRIAQDNSRAKVIALSRNFDSIPRC